MGIDSLVDINPGADPGMAWVPLPPGAPQSLSPFESRSTTLAVLWSTLIVASMVLAVFWVFWP